MIAGGRPVKGELFSLVFVDAGMKGLWYLFARKLPCPHVPHTKLTFQQMIAGDRPVKGELSSLVFVAAGMEGLWYSFARKLLLEAEKKVVPRVTQSQSEPVCWRFEGVCRDELNF